MLLCRAAPLHIQYLVLVNDDDEVEEEDRESRRDCNSCWVQHNKRREICYYERMTSRREDGVVMLLCLVEGAFSRLVLMRVYCRSGRLRCGRFWMAFQQRSKLGLKGQGVSRVTPSRGWGPTLPHTWRAQKAWILRATSSAFQYSAPMPPCRQRSPIICRKRTVPSYRHNTLSPHVPIVLHIHDHSVPPGSGE